MRNFICLIITCFAIGTCSEISLDEFPSIENEQFKKVFICKEGNEDVIRPIILDKHNNRILCEEGSPYFEFVINGELVSSEDKLWIYKGIYERELQNKGLEYILNFEGSKGAVDGLGLTIKQQVFPGSTLHREKIILHSNERIFSINKKKDKLHFIFPCYNLKIKEDEKLESTEIQLASWELRPPDFDQSKNGNHMFYPKQTHRQIEDAYDVVKGPIRLVTSDSLSWFTAYEHASQDNVNGMLDEKKTGEGKYINDAMQGTKGVFNFPLVNDNFLFHGIGSKKENDHLAISVEAFRGAYLDGELIDPEHSYESLWIASGFYYENSSNRAKEVLREYLFSQICENAASRKPEFYYNTWGMQREDPGRSLRGILTYDKVFEEIDNAAELGVDIFVLDDGWEEAMGIWTPNKKRFPEGLRPIKEKLDEYGMKMGLWLSPMGIDSTTSRYKEHPEWVILDSEQNPIQAQWGHPAFDFVSDFFNLFIDDCKSLIDQGCLYMKWDAINSFYSSLSGLHHGTDEYSANERMARYEYLLPIYVVRAMELLTEYEPDLIIEIDLTEARRVMIGLAPLSQGKLFFMNNGASTYNDYSTYRTKSTRTIANEYSGIIPLELFTYASYPHNIAGSMEYNVNSSILAGHGFWGDLSLMSHEEREYVGRQLKTSKRVLPYISQTMPLIDGKVGDSPEIYSVINNDNAVGQIVAFSEKKVSKHFEQALNVENFLGVLNHAYCIKDGVLMMDFDFPENESSKLVFVLSNTENRISILSSSASLEDVYIDDGSLFFETKSGGDQVIYWPRTMGIPNVKSNTITEVIIEKEADAHLIYIRLMEKGSVELKSK